MKNIDEQIKWYEEHATRKEDDLITENLNLINGLYEKVEYSEDKIFLDKIIATFCEIIETQREVIDSILIDAEGVDLYTDFSQKDFTSDKQLQEAFTHYCSSSGKSSYTVNDYCSRIRNLWNSFYREYQSRLLPEELCVNEEIIRPDTPLLNAFNHTEELGCYVQINSAKSKENRNFANTRAAFNKFEKFKQSLPK